MNYSDAGGLSQLAGTFLQTYMSERARRDQMKQQNLAQALQAKTGGFQLNATGDDWQMTPEKEAEQGLLNKKQALESADYEVDTPYANSTAGLLRSTYKAAHPNISDEELMQIVPNHLSPAQYKKQSDMLKTDISGTYGFLGKQAIAGALGQRNATAQGNLDWHKKTTASGLAKEITNDAVVKAVDTQQNSIVKGLQQLNSKDKPITLQMLNEIQNDYANAITGGRQAAQGTIHDQQMQTLEARAANLKQYITGNPQQAATPQQIEYFKTAFKELQGLNQEIRKQRVHTLSQPKRAAFDNDPNVNRVLDQMESGADGSGLIPPAADYEPDVVAYAKAHNISNEQAQAVKMKRTGK